MAAARAEVAADHEGRESALKDREARLADLERLASEREARMDARATADLAEHLARSEELAKLRGENQALQSKVADLETSITAANDRLREADEALAKERAAHVADRESLATRNAENERRMALEVDRAREAGRDAKTKITAAEKAHAERTAELQSVVDTLRQEQARAIQEIQALTAAVASVSAERDAAIARTNSALEENARLREMLSTMESLTKKAESLILSIQKTSRKPRRNAAK